MSESGLLERVILSEVAGKNQAIHAYDRMMWTVRTGFLTLYSAGWGIFLKATMESQCTAPNSLGNRLLLVMLLVSLVLGIGGFIVDQSYARRKFRVIYALDQQISGIVETKGQIQERLEQIATTMHVSGDKCDDNYRNVSGLYFRGECELGYLLPANGGRSLCSISSLEIDYNACGRS